MTTLEMLEKIDLLTNIQCYNQGYKQGIFDILDKLKVEIKGKIIKRPWLDFEDRERDRNDAFLELLDIIDKYKANTEKIFNSISKKIEEVR